MAKRLMTSDEVTNLDVKSDTLVKFNPKVRDRNQTTVSKTLFRAVHYDTQIAEPSDVVRFWMEINGLDSDSFNSFPRGLYVEIKQYGDEFASVFRDVIDHKMRVGKGGDMIEKRKCSFCGEEITFYNRHLPCGGV